MADDSLIQTMRMGSDILNKRYELLFEIKT